MSFKKQANALIPTQWGDFKMMAFSRDENDVMPHIALVHEGFESGNDVLVRMHSECITGDLFTSKRCDCGEQLDESMKMIAKAKGILIYLRQEGRGIGIINKLKAYRLQDGGLNTIEANEHLGLPVDSREYIEAIDILKQLGVKSVRLVTNNPIKINAFTESGITITEIVPIVIEAHKDNYGYLETKSKLMGHRFEMKKVL